MPRGAGSGVGSLNASAIRSGCVYVPSDQVISSGVRSDDSMYGGATKSVSSTLSPVRASQGNSPSTKNVSAFADWKCLNVVPLYSACGVPAIIVSFGAPLSTTTSFQCPSYSVR